MLESITLLLIMFFGFGLGIALYVHSVQSSDKVLKLEVKIFNWLGLEDKKQSGESAVEEPVSQKLIYELGEALAELKTAESYEKIRNEIHPKAIEYYKRSKGQNIKVADIVERPKLKLVK
ncbi:MULTISPECIES: hypothetical protein [unclassified Pseudoalteromonas]|uniref:hypothetical protein n=1 Tax=unclassified Pseudoalteromonas TaxID=194690 RepID=UPI001F399DA4|nr:MULTISPECIES: hypothetical protein [unclassified Pseudoalteromonas]MCF2825677.1 hypothetical protein [Pseudoalteromonas sp. OF5H-5]MCF2833272.1 hypothetical protein [Pseudoalteromonas sp. DL2-H6]MCF2923763.1 hypothetical protein [Pseudoalteromonas sp. DL2-H1]